VTFFTNAPLFYPKLLFCQLPVAWQRCRRCSLSLENEPIKQSRKPSLAERGIPDTSMQCADPSRQPRQKRIMTSRRLARKVAQIVDSDFQIQTAFQLLSERLSRAELTAAGETDNIASGPNDGRTRAVGDFSGAPRQSAC
jgi:hypothetical protein